MSSTSNDHSFLPAGPTDRRSPCPALNSLANHGYLPRHGTQITFTHLLQAVKTVYNLSLPLALLPTLAGFLTCAKLSVNPAEYRRWSWLPVSVAWTLDLADLSARGWAKLAHDASLVHPSGIPSHAPDPALLADLLATARAQPNQGLTFRELVAVHAARLRTLSPRHPLSTLHARIAAAECAIAWLVMRHPATGVVEVDTLAQWFGEERLPEEWQRPREPIALLQARRSTNEVQRIEKQY
ncbi:Chloroperoxidase [Mycena pura]|uniref:Chloroperoxidase n=1 Tax=Mycena pura TaxID=153505 RepID=A0AAD6UPI5_9AGAR|nr:Chloroperoxidase [Mycena pura]